VKTNFFDLGQPLMNPVHNAQVYYFNNVWLMFLVFKKNFFFSNHRWSPPLPRPGKLTPGGQFHRIHEIPERGFLDCCQTPFSMDHTGPE